MASFDAYVARVNQRGDTERERTLYYQKHYLKNLAVNSLSCKSCLVNGVNQSLVIDDGTLPYYKDVKSLPDEYFNAGDQCGLLSHATGIKKFILMAKCNSAIICLNGRIKMLKL